MQPKSRTCRTGVQCLHLKLKKIEKEEKQEEEDKWEQSNIPIKGRFINGRVIQEIWIPTSRRFKINNGSTKLMKILTRRVLLQLMESLQQIHLMYYGRMGQIIEMLTNQVIWMCKKLRQIMIQMSRQKLQCKISKVMNSTCYKREC